MGKNEVSYATLYEIALIKIKELTNENIMLEALLQAERATKETDK